MQIPLADLLVTIWGAESSAHTFLSQSCRRWSFSFTGAAGGVGGCGDPWLWYTAGKHGIEQSCLAVAFLHEAPGMAEAPC